MPTRMQVVPAPISALAVCTSSMIVVDADVACDEADSDNEDEDVVDDDRLSPTGPVDSAADAACTVCSCHAAAFSLVGSPCILIWG